MDLPPLAPVRQVKTDRQPSPLKGSHLCNIVSSKDLVMARCVHCRWKR